MEAQPEYVDPTIELANLVEAQPDAMRALKNLAHLSDRVGYEGVLVFVSLLKEALADTRMFVEMFRDIGGGEG